MVTHLDILRLLEQLWPTQYNRLAELYSAELDEFEGMENYRSEKDYMVEVFRALLRTVREEEIQ